MQLLTCYEYKLIKQMNELHLHILLCKKLTRLVQYLRNELASQNTSNKLFFRRFYYFLEQQTKAMLTWKYQQGERDSFVLEALLLIALASLMLCHQLNRE